MTDPVLGDGSASYTPGVSVRSGGNVRYQRTGLKLLGQGYCDPSTGRFLTRDPINGRPKRSVVADVAIGPRSEPWGVLDWKSGRGMSKRTRQRYADTITTGRVGVIVEVRRSGVVANSVRDNKGVN